MLTVRLLEHLPHPFDLAVVHLLVLFERDVEGIGSVDGSAIIWLRSTPTTHLLELRDIDRAWWSATERSITGCATTGQKVFVNCVHFGS